MINLRMLMVYTCLSLSYTATAQAPDAPLTLPECQSLALANYPLIKQRGLIALRAQHEREQANMGYLPQISLGGHATYQSDVTRIPLELPGVNMPMLDKDQYKLYGELTQILFDGGAIKHQKAAAEAEAAVEAHALEVELYKIRERVNQLFFGILLLDAQLKQNELLQQDLRLGLDKTNAAIANGTALRSSGDLLKAELLRAEQHRTEIRASRQANLMVLGRLINRPLNEHTVLEKPQAPSPPAGTHRPELDWYASQQNRIEANRRLLTAKYLPKLSFFLQAGAGRPALNLLSNAFDPYYYGGIRLAVPISGLYTLKKEKAVLEDKARSINVQRENFLFNNELKLTQENTESAKYARLLETDDEIITLRTSVKETALAQLENGVIHPADYLREVNAEDQAKLAKMLHELQWLITQYNIQHTTGN